MRFSLALALFASVLMILGASWARFGAAEKYHAQLTLLEPSEEDITELQEFLKTTASSTQEASPALGDTDHIGRQLITDYVALATNGGANASTLEALAEKYVENIPTLNKAPVVTLAEIKSVSDAEINFSIYEDRVNAIHQAYADKMQKAYSGQSALKLSGASLYKFNASLASAYQEAAAALKSVPVPMSLAQAHLRLVNSYFSSATAMHSLSDPASDPAVAFAGILALNEDIQTQNAILMEISQIIKSHGI